MLFRSTGRVVQLPAHNAAEVEQILAAVRQAGLVAEDIEIRKADLEDVFLDVMAESGATPADANAEANGFTAGPPQGETAPSGGREDAPASNVGARS